MDEPTLSDNAIDYTKVTFLHSNTEGRNAFSDNICDDVNSSDDYADSDVDFDSSGSYDDEECAEVPLLEESNRGSKTPGEGAQRSRCDSYDYDVDIMTTRLMIHADEFFKNKDRSRYERKKALLFRAGIVIFVFAIIAFAAHFFLGPESPIFSNDLSADEVTEELSKCLDGKNHWLNRLMCGCYWNGRYHQCDVH